MVGLEVTISMPLVRSIVAKVSGSLTDNKECVFAITVDSSFLAVNKESPAGQLITF